MSFEFNLDIGLTDAVERCAAAFEEYGSKAFPRAVQYSVIGVSIDGVQGGDKTIQ